MSVVQMARAGVFRQGPGNFWTSRWTDASGEEVASVGYRVAASPDRGLVLQLSYTITDNATAEKTLVEYRVELTTTPCHFGGRRYWFLCPLVHHGRSCGRPAGKLYLPRGGRYFRCRICYDLTYRSCQEHDKRVNVLLKLPAEVLRRAMESGDLRTSLLALKAAFKALDKHGDA